MSRDEPKGLQIRNATLRFDVSRAGECLRWYVESNGNSLAPPSLSHCGAFLLLMARRRLGDIEAGLPEDQCGWLTLQEIKLELGASAGPLLAVGVAQVRKMFDRLGFAAPWGILERKPAANSFRLGTALLELRMEDGR